jgi:hypothetical protein
MRTQIQTRIGLAVGLALALLGGLAPRAEAAITATGGNYTSDIPGYRVHVFTNSVTASNFVVSAASPGDTIEVLVVAGGGGGGKAEPNGGGDGGGGGGAGGLVYSNAFQVVAGSNYTVTVGGGGAGATVLGNTGGSGTNSAFDTIIAYGGGGGGSDAMNGVGGGSGGGAGSEHNASYTGGSATNGQGNAGGNTSGGAGGSWGPRGGASGGGAGAPGRSEGIGTQDSYNDNKGRPGGAGAVCAIIGSNVVYAGGGGGGGGGTTGGAGGTGGGGPGGNNNAAGTVGTANTGGGGGGGGGGGTSGNGGNGGSGIVIVRYATMSASGGTITNVSGDRVHAFVNSGLFTLPEGRNVEVLVVGGGGGGGMPEVNNGGDGAGGGGAGGVVYNPSTWLAAGTYSVTVGAGGAGSSAQTSRGGNGGDSVFNTIRAYGGGGGGSDNDSSAANDGAHGGSGGGAANWYNNPSSGGSGTNTQGSAGAGCASSTSNRGGAGGGGATGNGITKSGNAGGAGGAGTNISITGSAVDYAGGGGGGANGSNAGGSAGSGGGGAGGGNGGIGGDGTIGTGGGGGGGGSPNNVVTIFGGGNGGSGIVIVRYPTNFVADLPQIQNRSPSGISTTVATFNGYLVTNGTENAGVYVAWGQTNGSVSGSWASTNFWPSGAWTNGSSPATNMTLAANANYYYTFGATNSTTNVVASGYQYLITGEVTVQPTDPTGRVTLADTAAFTVYRPTSCTNEALTVAYTLGGTATNATHYTNSPPATGTNGTVTIPAGQTNAVVTVYPLNVLALQQTVVLSLVSSNYAIGSANSATCTLAAVTGYTYNDALNGNWNATSTWNPSTGYPVSNDFAVIDSQTVTANISLTNSTAPASITVSTGGTVAHASGVVVASPVTMNGGTWQGALNAGSAMRLTGAVTVTTNSLFTGGRGSVGVWLDGPVSGTGLLTFRGVDSYQGDGPDFYLTAASNTHSGGIVVEDNYAYLYAVSNQSLGTGDITVNADGRLVFPRTQDYTGAPRTPVVTLATNSSVVQFTTTDSMTLPFGLVVQNGGKLTTDAWRLGEVWSGAVTLNANLTLAAVRASGSGTSMILSGLVSGPGGIVVYAEDAWDGDQGLVELRRGTNTYSGGTTIGSGRLKVTADGALGTGPVTVYNTLITGGGSPATKGYRASLLLDATPDMNWTLTNALAGEGTIKVEDGSNYRLTEGGTVGPGTNTAAVAVLTVNGKFAFAKNGGTPATLAIDVASAGTAPGTDHDQLAVSAGDATLASSITNCALVVSLVPMPTAMNGLTLTILSAPGADFSAYTFASVTGLGAGGSVVYNNGSITLTWTAATPIINNGAYSNLLATSCDVSGYLSSTGDTPTVVRCYYGTNSAGTSGWAYTNDLGTRVVGTVSTSLAGLTSNVKYYYRFYATNDVGEYWSVATSNFTTLGDIYWNDVATGGWKADNANTWGAGANVYPQNALNDHVTVDSHLVSVTSGPTIVAADVTLTTSGSTTGRLSFVNAAAHNQSFILDGGRLGVFSDGTSPGDVVLGGNLKVKSASILDPGTYWNSLNTHTTTLNGNIEDYGPGTTGVLRVDGALYAGGLDAAGRVVYNGVSTNFSGGWLIQSTANGALESYYAWFGVYQDGGLGASTVTVTRGQLKIDATQSSTAPRPAPGRVIVNAEGRLRISSGVNVTNWTVDLNGGQMWWYGASKYAGGTLAMNANSIWFGATAGNKEYAGTMSGVGRLDINPSGGSGPFILSGNNSGFSGGIRLLADNLTVSHANGLGTGPVLLASQNGGKLTLDQPSGSFDWTLANDISGTNTIQVEDGAGNNSLTVLGELAPGTNTAAVGILRVDGDLAFGGGSTLRMDIAGDGGVAGVDFDQLVVDHDVTSLAGATLELNVKSGLTFAQMELQPITVLTSATAIPDGFGTVTLNVPWGFAVIYNQPTGTVKLIIRDATTVLMFR